MSRSGSKDFTGAVLDGGESGASVDASACAGPAARRGARVERVRSPPVGTPGGIRLRDGRGAVPALSLTRPLFARACPPAAEGEWFPLAHRGRHRSGRALSLRVGDQQGYGVAGPELSQERRARRAESALVVSRSHGESGR